jgi:hypothetical protein
MFLTARPLSIFGDGASGNQWKREFRIAIAEALEWSESPYLLPLLEAFDEHERFAVVLTHRERSRIFAVHAGEAGEVSDLAAGDVGRKRTTGMDHRWSEANFHRRVDVTCPRNRSDDRTTSRIVLSPVVSGEWGVGREVWVTGLRIWALAKGDRWDETAGSP